MRPTISGIHWPAVLAATLAYFLVGVPIFSLFGNVWEAAGFKAPEGWQPGAEFYALPLLATFLSVFATAVLARATRADGTGDGAFVGLLVALGYLVPTAGIDAMSPAHPQPMKIFLITGAYHLVGSVLAGMILGAWRKKAPDAPAS